eukprot:gene18462-845_t
MERIRYALLSQFSDDVTAKAIAHFAGSISIGDATAFSELVHQAILTKRLGPKTVSVLITELVRVRSESAIGMIPNFEGFLQSEAAHPSTILLVIRSVLIGLPNNGQVPAYTNTLAKLRLPLLNMMKGRHKSNTHFRLAVYALLRDAGWIWTAEIVLPDVLGTLTQWASMLCSSDDK